MTENEIGTAIVRAAMAVHSRVGPGLLESAYSMCLAHELARGGIDAKREVSIAVRYADLEVTNAYRVDLLVAQKVIAELKAIETVLPVHRSQLLSYLRLGGFKLGYLLNFHVDTCGMASHAWSMVYDFCDHSILSDLCDKSSRTSRC